MKKRAYFEQMPLPQLEAELAQLQAQKKLHHEQRTYRKWMEQIIVGKRAKQQAHLEEEQRIEQENLPDTINQQHVHEWGLFMDDMIPRCNARLAARGEEGAKDHAPWNEKTMWFGQADMQMGVVEKFAERGEQAFILADESNFKRVNDIITSGIPLAMTKFVHGKDFEPIPVIKDVEVTNEWKEILLGGVMTALEYAALIRKGNLRDQIKMAFEHAHVTALIGEEDMVEHLKPAATEALSKHGIHTTQELYIAARNPKTWAALERELDQHITLSPPRSFEEAYLRTSVYYQLLAHSAQNVGSQQVADLHDRLARNRISRTPVLDELDLSTLPPWFSYID